MGVIKFVLLTIETEIADRVGADRVVDGRIILFKIGGIIGFIVSGISCILLFSSLLKKSNRLNIVMFYFNLCKTFPKLLTSVSVSKISSPSFSWNTFRVS